MAVFTKGNAGSEAYTKKVKAHADAVELNAPNTVGAGDNFNAGFALNLAKNGFFTPQAIIDMPQDMLQKILAAANNNSAEHLKNQGAVMLEKKKVV
jgi:sugar/nucleoside kinase (ribokinase family)